MFWFQVARATGPNPGAGIQFPLCPGYPNCDNRQRALQQGATGPQQGSPFNQASPYSQQLPPSQAGSPFALAGNSFQADPNLFQGGRGPQQGLPYNQASPYSQCPGYPNCDVNLLAAEQATPSQAGSRFALAGNSFQADPNLFQDGRNSFQGSQESFQGLPESFQGSPESFQDGINSFQGSPEQFQDGNSFQGSPEQFQDGINSFQDDPNLFQDGLNSFQDDPNLIQDDQNLVLISDDDESGGPNPQAGFGICPGYPYCGQIIAVWCFKSSLRVFYFCFTKEANWMKVHSTCKP